MVDQPQERIEIPRLRAFATEVRGLSSETGLFPSLQINERNF